MAERKRLSKLRNTAFRRVRLSNEEIQAARKVLETLANAEAPDDGDGLQAERPGSGRAEAVERARQAHALRERRLQIFNFSAEAPFLILLALYANEEWEPLVNLTRLTQLAWITYSTTLRWLDHLAREGLITRKGTADDGRFVLLSLTPLARSKMDEIFSED